MVHMTRLAIEDVSSDAQAGVRRSHFGSMPDGSPVEAIRLSNRNGMRATIITLGASIQSLIAKDRNGAASDVVLGYPGLDGYIDKPEYFGATVGRFANRIAEGRFTLDGTCYQTPVNNGPNALHGGAQAGL